MSSHLRIAVMSSRVDPTGDNSSGGIHAYIASKAAVNVVLKSMSIDVEYENILVILVHPGIVKVNFDRR
jgi:NAD(P)-dependent dehydrogenase (short-subunit alcohol dehydrogenase family)